MSNKKKIIIDARFWGPKDTGFGRYVKNLLENLPSEPKTNVVLIRATTILASIFLITCLGLAILSAKREKSLIDENVVAEEPVTAKPLKRK